MKVSILLATYNSEKFLEEQLNSLVRQTYSDWNLYIRDDGSVDNTLKIIEEYKSKDNRIIVLRDDDNGLGAAKSFLKLLKSVESDYFFFCDHDDVWFDNKIEISMKKIFSMEGFEPRPLIVHSDLTVVDDKLEVIHPSFWKSSAIKPEVIGNKTFIQVFNCVTGCTMLINKEAKEVSFPIPRSGVPMHDWWIAIQVLKNNGEIVFLNESTIKYRQHGSNEVGARTVGRKYIFDKIIGLKQTLQGNLDQINFLKEIGGIGMFRYFVVKLYYSLIRKI